MGSRIGSSIGSGIESSSSSSSSCCMMMMTTMMISYDDNGDDDDDDGDDDGGDDVYRYVLSLSMSASDVIRCVLMISCSLESRSWMEEVGG